MPLPKNLKTPVKNDVPLGPMTSFGIGGAARFFADVKSPDEVLDLIHWACSEGAPVFAIGGGSNVLVADDGLDALVIKPSSDGLFGSIEFGEEDGLPVVTAGSGVHSAVLLEAAVEKGFSGLEFLTGIPGTVGGAVACNSGGRFGRINDVLAGFEGIPFTLGKKEKEFYWLDKARDAENFFISKAVFRLKKDDTGAIKSRIAEIHSHRRNTQPQGVRSAGCFFRNPPGDNSAGKLIDMAGMKGRKRGGAEVSAVHANYIVNTGGATAFDVLRLALDVAAVVKEMFKVSLAFEVDIWGESLEELIAGKGYF